ncbi:MAG: helix-turn-helix domain-containing protein [Clostridium fessum]
MASRRDLNYDDPFVERLRNLRKEHNYSFKELQALTGISSSSLQRYEKVLALICHLVSCHL